MKKYYGSSDPLYKIFVADQLIEDRDKNLWDYAKPVVKTVFNVLFYGAMMIVLSLVAIIAFDL